MAEFCKDCYISICGGSESDNYRLSKELDLCEGCGQYKRVVVSVRPTLKSFIGEWREYLQYRKEHKGDK